MILHYIDYQCYFEETENIKSFLIYTPCPTTYDSSFNMW